MRPSRIGVLLALLCLSSTPLLGAIPASERAALIAVYESTNGASWNDDTGWLGPAGSECTWFGVVCNVSQSNVRDLDLHSNGMTGALPPQIGELTRLVQLVLYDNQIAGPIPNEITTLADLFFIGFDSNRLTGPIPPAIGNLRSLGILRLQNNQLSGAIPSSLTGLPNITELDLRNNQLTGGIPAAIGNLTTLKALRLSNNTLGGTIPASIGNLTLLEDLGLSEAELGGTLPEGLSNLTKLIGLSLDVNNFEGSLPSGFGNLTELQYLVMFKNDFSGPLPADIGNLRKLSFLRAELNRFSGSIPESIGGMESLETARFYANRLTGPIPDSIGNLRKLKEIRLGQNRLSGPLPASIGNITSLEVFSAQENQLSGDIPASIWNLPALSHLDLQSNQLSGTLPSDIQKATKLENLSVHSNLLTGAIPSGIGNIPPLQRFLVFGNNMRGEIPSSIVNLANLNELRLEFNAFTASDPAVVSFITNHPSQFVEPFNLVLQNVAPGNVKVDSMGSFTATLSWTPIQYASDSGGYQVLVSTTPGGVGTPVLTTNYKSDDGALVTGLQPSTKYYFRIVTVTYPHGGRPDYQLNTVFSDPSAEVSATTLPPSTSPAQVLVTAVPRGLFQGPGAGGATDSYTLTNIGGEATTITLSQSGTFFQQAPSSFTLQPGASQQVLLTGNASPEGEYNGQSLPSGAGVAPGTAIGVSLLSAPSPASAAAIVAGQSRLDLVAPEGTDPSGTLRFRNVGTGSFTGVATADVQFLQPQLGLITIPPGGEITLPVTAIRALRPDSDLLSGTQVGRVALSGLAGFDANGRITLDGSTSTSLATVVDTVKPATSVATIPQLGSGEVALYMTSVGHVAGSVGEFLSDVSILNLSFTNRVPDLKLFYTPFLTDAKTKLATLSSLGSTQAISLADAVKSVFDGDAEVGTLQIRSSRAATLSASANIFNASNPAGNYGTSIPVFRSDRSVAAGGSIILTGLRKDATGHTNFYIQETRGSSASVDVEYLGDTGQLLGGTTVSLGPFAMTRLVNPLPDGSVATRLRNSGGAGAFAAYATPVDRASGDTWAVADWSLQFGYDPAEPVVIPIAGAVRGANDTFFRTDVAITNRCEQKVDDPALFDSTPCRLSSSEGTLRYHPTSGGVMEKSIELGLLETAVLPDVVRSAFGIETDTIGHLELVPVTGAFAVTSRTYTTVKDSAATFGSTVPAIGRSIAIRPGQSLRLGALTDSTTRTVSAKTPGTSRTNYGIVETSGEPVTVRVSVYYNDPRSLAAGKPLGTKDYQLAPNQLVNVSGLVGSILGPARETLYGDLSGVQVQFDVVSQTGAVLVYTSSVDNGTGDSILRTQ